MRVTFLTVAVLGSFHAFKLQVRRCVPVRVDHLQRFPDVAVTGLRKRFLDSIRFSVGAGLAQGALIDAAISCQPENPT